jgi:hypothetical protein
MVTLIGTPPNIIIATFRGDALGQPFRHVRLRAGGAVAAIAGLPFVALIGWRLIPQPADDSGAGADPLAELAPYIAELRVPEERRTGSAALRRAGADAAKAAM